MELQRNISRPFDRKTFRKHRSLLTFSFRIVKPVVAVTIAHLLLLHLFVMQILTVNAKCPQNLLLCFEEKALSGVMLSDPNADEMCSVRACADDDIPPSSTDHDRHSLLPDSLLPADHDSLLPDSLLPADHDSLLPDHQDPPHCCKADGLCCCDAIYHYFADTDNERGEDSSAVDDVQNRFMDFNIGEDTDEDGEDNLVVNDAKNLFMDSILGEESDDDDDYNNNGKVGFKAGDQVGGG